VVAVAFTIVLCAQTNSCRFNKLNQEIQHEQNAQIFTPENIKRLRAMGRNSAMLRRRRAAKANVASANLSLSRSFVRGSSGDSHGPALRRDIVITVFQ
jgi:hypothetical protein